MNKWTKEQEEAINRSGTNIIVSAGAGSGKTAVLTERTIRKLLNGGSIDRLLILTFTNAAAGEMKNRIRKAIKKAGLKEQLDLIDSSYITTFDSFAMTIVKKYHEYLKISPNIQIMDSSIEELKSKEILDNIFEESYEDDNFKNLINDFCIKTDNNIKNVVREISKKLDLLSNKNEYLNSYVDTHYNLDYVKLKKNEYINCIIELKDSIRVLYDRLCSYVDEKFLTTYNIEPLLNSSTYEDIKENLELIGSPRKNKNCSDDYKYYKDEIKNILDKLIDLTRFNDEEEIIDSYMSTKVYVDAIIKVINKYDNCFKKYKDETNLYTFNDVALMAIKVVKENESVRDELIESFDEIMVDEYQDTSDIQEEFINLISNNNLYMVGDIKQSIYRFRNANPSIFKNKYDEYSKNNGGIKIDLLKNFRSRSEVLDNINLIFNLVMDSEVGDASYKESHQMNYGNTKYSSDWNTDQNYNMDILTYKKDEIEEYSTDEVEAFTIANDIKDKIKNKYQIVDKENGMLRDCTYKDFSIIMDRGTSFDLYKKIFEYMGIPIVQIKNETLTISDDIIALSNLIGLIVKVYLNEMDDEFKYLFASVSRSYIYRISDEELFDIVVNNKYCETDLYRRANIDISELSNIEFLERIIDKFDIYKKLITLGNIKESIIRIDYLKDLCVNLSNTGYTPLNLKDYMLDMIKTGNIEYSLNQDGSDSVKILNIHKSKGLEYNICYFAGLSKKANEEERKSRFLVDSNYNIIVPYINDGIKDTIIKDISIINNTRADISERIRLFYVALTRVKEKIIIVVPFNDKKESFNYLVPKSVRLRYSRMSDILDSIRVVLNPYIKNIDINNINLNKDYEKLKSYNYKDKIVKSNIKIDNRKLDIIYEERKDLRFSKSSKRIITKEEYYNMNYGTKLHEIFEYEDFKTTNNKYILKFLKHIDTNFKKIYKEYEILYEENNTMYHGFIDLMLEYNNHIDIIDYKMKNIEDEAYIKQLNGYKKYISEISKKDVYIYLYSIVDDTLKSFDNVLI